MKPTLTPPFWAATPSPDAITIDRADLPEVTVDGEWVTFDYAGRYAASVKCVTNARDARRKACQQLALSEFLEARERQAAEDAAAEKLGEQVMQKRRDELAKEIAKNSCFIEFGSFIYEDHVIAVQVAIDMLIAEQDAASAD